MQVLPLTTKSIGLAISYLERGGIVAHPTETCYGLACDLTNPSAVARLFDTKKRPLDQPVSALFASVMHAKEYVMWNTQAEELAQKFLPGPLTLILPLRHDAPHAIFLIPPSEQRAASSEQRHIGIRISSHLVTQKLVTLFGKPISTTSANVHGQPAAYSAAEILSQFPGDLPDVLIIDGGLLPIRPPSTIIDLTGPFPQELRRGNLNP